MNPRIFDSHLHIIDPAFPLVPNNGYLPDPFTTSDYLVMARFLGVAGGAVVSGSFQAFDQDYLLSALERLGPRFVGVTQLPASVSDAEIKRLDELCLLMQLNTSIKAETTFPVINSKIFPFIESGKHLCDCQGLIDFGSKHGKLIPIKRRPWLHHPAETFARVASHATVAQAS